MWIASDAGTSVARLLGLLVRGERLAETCAKRQAALAPTAGMRRFLLMQNKHEAFHARVLQSATLGLNPRGAPIHDASRHLERYQHLLEQALERGRFEESLLAQQVILEGFGDVVLTRLADGAAARGFGFERIRHLLLGQEDAHHAFGLMSLEKLISQGSIRVSTLRSMSRPYIELLHEMVSRLDDLFGFFDEAPGDYIDAMYEGIPITWLDEPPFSFRSSR